MNKSNLQILDEDGGPVVICDGIRVQFNAKGGIDVYGAVPVTLHPATNNRAEPQAKADPQAGDRMEDGTIFAGISPDTGKPMYTTPADAPLTMKWREAMNYAAKLDAHDHDDWRLPSRAELNALYNNRAAISGFDTSGSFPAGYYWSSSEYNSLYAWYQGFSDGFQGNGKHDGLSVRCVRR